MTPRNLDSSDVTGRHSILSQIHEGMDVYDYDDNRIGVVDFVHFGAASETQQAYGTGPATSAPADSVQMRDESFVDMIAEAFFPQEVPTELNEKLLREGYVRMDATGLFAADRFITPDQIDSVTEDRVRLNATRDQLIKRR